VAPEADVVAVAISEILEEAARLRSLETPPGEVAELGTRWDEIAQDVGALAREVESGALAEPQRFGDGARTKGGGMAAEPAGGRDLRGLAASAVLRSSRTAKAVSRRGVGAAKRIAGPRLRSLERRSIDEAGRAAEALATRGHVVADHARRVATSGGRSGRLDRVSPGGRVLPSAGLGGATGSAALARPAITGPAGRRAPHAGDGGDDVGAGDLERWVLERLERCPPGVVLHVESSDGAFVAALIDAGHQAAGADPAAGAGSGNLGRAGALEHLGAQARHSLAGLVVSGATERVSPGSARALVHLASTRLRPDGIVVLVSAHPPAADAGDPISADLVSRRPLHPVTWCHLLARLGFAEITVFDRGVLSGPARSLRSPEAEREAEGTGGAYAVAARRP